MRPVSPLKDKFLKLAKLPVVKGALSILTAQVLRIFVQLAYFVLLIRTLGAQEYGLFIGIMAFVRLLYPFSNWGWSQILVQNVSRNREFFLEYWGNALLVSTVFGACFTAVVTLISPLILRDNFSLTIVVSVALAELIFGRIYDVSLKAFAALDLFHLNAVSQILVSASNLIAVLCLTFLFQVHDAVTWSLIYLISRAISALVSFVLLLKTTSLPRVSLSLILPRLKEGLFFSIGLSSSTIYNDSDKTMLAQLSTLEATGIYSAAYRIIDVAIVPVMSLLTAIGSRFFRKGEGGIAEVFSFTRRLLPFVTGYGLSASIGIFILAPLITDVLGRDYAEATEALRWLSFILIFRVLQYFAADTLTGADYQSTRSVLQILIAGLNIGLNFWLIPLYSWRGAALSSLISDALLSLSLWIVVLVTYRRHLSTSDCVVVAMTDKTKLNS